MHDNHSEIAPLNLCDRVEVLDEIISNPNTPFSADDFDGFLDFYYPCFVMLCEELRGKAKTEAIETTVNELGATFHVFYEGGEEATYEFEGLSEDIFDREETS